MLSFNGNRVSNVTFKGTPVKEVCYRKNSACTKIFGTPHNSVCFNNANSPVTVTCTIRLNAWDTCEEEDIGYEDDPSSSYDVYDDDMTINPGEGYIKIGYGCRRGTSFCYGGSFTFEVCDMPINLSAAFNSTVCNNYGDYTACSRVTPTATLTNASLTVYNDSGIAGTFSLNPSISFTSTTDGCVSLHGIGNCNCSLNTSSCTTWCCQCYCNGIESYSWWNTSSGGRTSPVQTCADLSLTFTITPTWTNTINKTEMTIDSEGRPTCDGSL